MTYASHNSNNIVTYCSVVYDDGNDNSSYLNTTITLADSNITAASNDASA